MKHAIRLSKLGPGKKLLIGLVLVAAVVTALFDWNWFRRPLERYVSEKSGREVRIEDLHVRLGLSLEPTVRLRGVHIPNASWASRQPMAVAGEAIFTFSLGSVWQHRPVISRLVLRDANVVLERHENGLRNWRLLHPENRGPGKIRVLTLEPHRTQIRFVHGGIEFEVLAAASPREQDGTAPQHEQSLSNQIDFKGSFRGTRFSGVTLTGEKLSFRDSGVAFPLRGHIASGSTRLDIEGFLADMFALSAMDARVRLAGPTLSQLFPFVQFRPAVSRPFEVEAQVTYAESVYTVTRLRGKIGGSKIAGEASFNRQNERPLLRAALQSDSADISDLAPLANINQRVDETPPHSVEAAAAAQKKPDRRRINRDQPQRDRNRDIFSEEPIHIDRLRAVDAHVTIDARKLTAAEIPALESGRLTVNLNDGRLQLNPIDLGMAGGRVAGSVAFDGHHQPPSSEAAITARNIRLEKMFPSISAAARSVATIRAQFKLAGRGNSIAAIVGNATGSAAAVMERGSISNLADARLGLNNAKILGLRIRGDRDIAITCGAVAFEFHNGKGKSGVILLDTEETHVDGVGTLDLRTQQLDMLLTPQLKKPAIFSSQKSIRVQGSFKNAAWSLVDRVPLAHPETKAPPALHALLRTAAENGEKSGGCAGAIAAVANAKREEK